MKSDIVADLWRVASQRIFPADFINVPHSVLEVGRLYYATVLTLAAEFERLGYVPRDTAGDEQRANKIWDETESLFNVYVSGEGAPHLLRYSRRVFLDAINDALAHLRSYPPQVATDVLPVIRDECLAYLARAAAVSEGAPMPPLPRAIRN
jgi:hypothetical protein